ncbi:hypothetical protein [Sphingopyxis sp.]|jgi:hypothetical protein|uniref:hypothetical protein n=1 Tax=Sphingopyxis sp. TaxID=1908224 RepID=UPI002DF69BA7|nr:hypothetical protein [Sphingopyxis sp.]
MISGKDKPFGRALLALLPVLTSTANAQPPAGDAPQAHSDDVEEIVVTAQWGAALVEPETELGEAEIDAYGAGSIGDLVSLIAPLTGRADERPVILINGERADGATGINGFPPEALAKLAILRPEAAERYGYPPGQRVVNLVLKKSFASWQAEAGAKMATAGGRPSGRTSLGRFVIDGKARWSARADLSHDDRLLKSERSAADDPDGAGTRRTLLPASDNMAFNVDVTRPLGRFNGTLGMDVARRDTRQLLGPAPENAAREALRGDQTTTNLGLTALLGGPLAGWHSNLVARYSRSWSESALERAEPPDIRTDRARSHAETLSAQVNLNRPILTLPAGMVTSNILFGASRNWSRSRRFDDRGPLPGDLEFRRRQYDARLSLAVPISSAASDRFSALGDLSIDIAGGISAASGTSMQKRFDLGMNWTPFPVLQLYASAGSAQLIPSADQLGGPYIEDVRRIYDYRQQELAEPVWITGGNPDLGRGRLRNYTLRASLRPFADPQIILTSEYQRQLSTGGAGLFPVLTPAVERAFPERIVRDADGRLVSVDARPIRIARDLSERLENSFILSFSTAKKADAAAIAPAAEPWQVTLSVNHGWLLRSELLTRPGIPPIDRLRGDTAQSRHSVAFQLVAGRAGAGGAIEGNWQSPFRLRDPASPGGELDYRHRGVTTLNLRLFAEPERLLRGAEKPAWLKDLNIALDVQNLLNSYRRVTLGDGSVPAGYRRYDADPLGRTIQLSVRKRF